MTIQNHILPASIAAAIHAALLWGWIQTPVPTHTTVIEVPLPPLPPKPDDAVVPQPEEKSETTQPVQPLAGGPAPVTLEEHFVTPKPTDITIPVDERPRDFPHDIKIFPPRFGPGETGIDGPGSDPSRYFSPTQLDRIPRATVRQPPSYPAAMQQSGISGTVTVEFDVDTAGRVVRAVAVHCSHREFADPAVRAVLQWRFEPGRRHGRPVPFRMAVPIEFNLAAD